MDNQDRGPYPVGPPWPPAPSQSFGAMPPKKRRIWPFVLIGVVVFALVATAAALATPRILALLRPGSSSSSSHSLAPGASFLNGATRSWGLDLKQQFPDLADVHFTFSPDTDDARSNFRDGPIVTDRAWIVPFWSGDRDDASSLLGLDPDTGKVLWSDRSRAYTTCSPVPQAPVVACAAQNADATASLVLLDPATGEVKSTKPYPSEPRSWPYLVTGTGGIVLSVEDPAGRSATLRGFDKAGVERWSQVLQFDAGDDMSPWIPIQSMGNYAVFHTDRRTWVMDVASGAVLVQARGSGVVTPSGFFLHDKTTPIEKNSGIKVLDAGAWKYTVATSQDGTRSVLLRSAGSSLDLCTMDAPTTCRDVITGLLSVESVSPDLMDADGHTYAVVSADYHGPETLVDIDSGQARTWTSAPSTQASSNRSNTVGPGPVFAAGPSGGGSVSIVNALTGAVVASGSAPGWFPIPVMPQNRLLLGYSTNQVGLGITKIAAYEPPTTPQGFVGPDSAPAASGPVGQGIPDCPSGTTRLAFATFPDGWILVCGFSSDRPTYWRVHRGSADTEATQVTYDTATHRYLARPPDGSTWWLVFSPAMYGWANSQGVMQQQTYTGQIWFVDMGNATPGTGSYQVPAPVGNANDQVRYLSEILARSAAARKSLQPAVQSVIDCAHGGGSYAGEAAVIDSVAQNRRDLITALSSAPVDQVPQGTTLVNRLTTALNFSLQADLAYASWARQVSASGCAAGQSSRASGEAFSLQAGTAKTDFVNLWNSVIQPHYSVPVVTREEL